MNQKVNGSQSGPNGSHYRVGVLFGGRSGEHEVSLASARNVMEALTEAGHQAVPIGIDQTGRWIATGDPMRQLQDETEMLANSDQSLPGEKPFSENGNNATGDRMALIPTKNGEVWPAIDVIFPVLHGPYGEDGTVQGMLEILDIPYVGCDVLSSAVAMDKAVAKKLFSQAGLPQAEYRVVTRERWQEDRLPLLRELEDALRYPHFVKPANLGSSVGVSRAATRTELIDAIELAAYFDRKIVVEQAVPAAREIEVSVLGLSHSLVHPPAASVPGEIIPGNDFYDYAAKYEDESSQLLIPAPLEPEQNALIKQMALTAFESIEGSGLSRVDFLMNGQTGEIFLNEVNTMPGFTRISMFPKLWEAAGISYPALVDKLIKLALVRFTDRQQNRNRR